jgi:aminoglycoside 3-N-acetyltransferase
MFLDKKQIDCFLQKLNIKKGDTIFFHGNSMGISQVKGSTPKEKTDFFWKCVKEFIGEKGTIIVPSFTYSINKTKIFDINKSKSKIGQFSEDFRQNNLSGRTGDPIFSVCVYGKEKIKIKKIPYYNSFGKHSIFGFLHSNNVKLICLGCSLEAVTFIHYVEQVLNVPYRKFKIFNAKILNKKRKIINKKIKFFCRIDNKNYNYNFNILKKEMIKKHKICASNFGRIKSYSFKARDFFSVCKTLIKKDNKILIDEICP